jgi:xylitol oxidase
MDKRTFLKLTTSMIAGTAISPILSCVSEKSKPMPPLRNWAGNLTYSTTNLLEPSTIEEVQEMVRKFESVRALGTRHCFNRIADSKENLISSRNLNKIIELNPEARTVKVGAGLRYGELAPYLDKEGWAIHNLASLPHISLAGACATATHGSGVNNGNLATSISAIEFVKADGEIVSLSRDKDPEFYGAVVNLGALGVVTTMTLDLVPAFKVRQDVYLNLPLEQLENHFDEIMSAGYSVSLFYDWQSEFINQVWIKSVVAKEEPIKAESEYFGAKLADRNVHPILEVSPENCTDQMGIPGPWHERLPHFRMDFMPSSGAELQAEYFVPQDKAMDAIKAVKTLSEELKSIIMITEVRAIAADNLWLSTAYNRSSIAIHFTLEQNVEAVSWIPKLEEVLEPFNARPHWGKLFSLDPTKLQARYEKMDDFKNLMKQFDPEGKFRNEFINHNLTIAS